MALAYADKEYADPVIPPTIDRGALWAAREYWGEFEAKEYARIYRRFATECFCGRDPIVLSGAFPVEGCMARTFVRRLRRRFAAGDSGFVVVPSRTDGVSVVGWWLVTPGFDPLDEVNRAFPKGAYFEGGTTVTNEDFKIVHEKMMNLLAEDMRRAFDGK